MVEEGKFTIDDYFFIFPIEEMFPLRVNPRGFDIFRYFLTHFEDEIQITIMGMNREMIQ